jgi:hypothetical protein
MRTYPELQAIWDERDGRYAYIRRSLTREEIRSVMDWRYTEACDVQVGRAQALARAISWTPPERKESRRI